MGINREDFILFVVVTVRVSTPWDNNRRLNHREYSFKGARSIMFCTILEDMAEGKST